MLLICIALLRKHLKLTRKIRERLKWNLIIIIQKHLDLPGTDSQV